MKRNFGLSTHELFNLFNESQTDILAGGGTCYRLVSYQYCDATITQTCPRFADHTISRFSPRDIFLEGFIDDQLVLDSCRMKVLR
jgi:hypothetical protein